MKKITYKLKQEAEGQEPTIVKSGHVDTFTPSGIRADLQRLEKLKKELQAQIELEKAKQQNVETHHEIVLMLTGEQLTAAAIYHDSKGMLKKCEDQMNRVLEAEKHYAEDIAEIQKQTGLAV